MIINYIIVNKSNAQEWLLLNPLGHRMQLTFTSFELETGYDYLYVGVGEVEERFTGSSIPGPFTSTDTGSSITVRMETDGSVTRRGFRAEWAAAPLGLF